MKLYQLKCPACGAEINGDSERKYMFCSYCGSKVYLDDEVRRVEINKNVQYHQIYTDEARIREYESEERLQRMQLEYKEREQKRNDKVVFICLGILVLISAFAFLMGYLT